MGAIGIDLGTYNSCVAFVDTGGKPHVIKSRHGPTDQGPVFPSFIKLDIAGQVLLTGEDARRAMEDAPNQVVWGTKRLIGRPYDAVAYQLRRFKYPTRKGSDGGVLIDIGLQGLRPQEIAGLLLSWIKRETEQYYPPLGGRADEAMVTYPAYFNPQQVNATREAAEGVGFAKVELIPEPVAAALAYGYGIASDGQERLMIIDCGAGTLDIVVGLLIRSKGKILFDETQAALGNVALGGLDMDDLLIAAVRERHGLTSLTKEEENLLRKAVVFLKHKLSKVERQTEFAVVGGRPLEVTMARRNAGGARESDWVVLEDALGPVLEKFRAEVLFAREKSGLHVKKFNHVVLIGGPMHMPCMRRIVRDVFAENPEVCGEIDAIASKGFRVDPMTAVAVGAALQGAGRAASSSLLNRDYGFICGERGEILLRRNDPRPAEATADYVLRRQGKPGDASSIGLFVRESSPEHSERCIRFGRYSFVPVFGPDGSCKYKPGLKVDMYGGVHLRFFDCLSGRALELAQLTNCEETAIECPEEFDPWTPKPPTPTLDLVDASHVSEERATGERILRIAWAKCTHARIGAESAKRKKLKEQIRSLERALAALPEDGSAPQILFQDCSIARETLRNLLEGERLLSAEDQRALTDLF